MGGGMSLAELSIWQCLSLGIEYYWPGCVFLAFFRAAHGRKCNGGVVELCESIAMSMALSVMVRYAGEKYGITCIDNSVVRIPVEFVLACIFGVITIYEASKTGNGSKELHNQKTPALDGTIGPVTSDCVGRHDIDTVGRRRAMSSLQLNYAVERMHREQTERAIEDALADLNGKQNDEQRRSYRITDGFGNILYYQGAPVHLICEDGIYRSFETDGVFESACCSFQRYDRKISSVDVAVPFTITEIW